MKNQIIDKLKIAKPTFGLSLLFYLFYGFSYGQINVSPFVSLAPNLSTLKTYTSAPSIAKERGFGFGSCIGGELIFPKNHSVSIGIQYLNKSINSDITITNSNGKQVKNIKTKETFNYINFPVLLSIRSKIGLGLKLGCYYSQLLSQTYKLSPDTTFEGTRPTIINYDYGVMAGIGYYKSISDKISIEIQSIYNIGIPKLREYIANVGTSYFDYYQKITSLSIDFKLIYHLKKSKKE